MSLLILKKFLYFRQKTTFTQKVCYNTQKSRKRGTQCESFLGIGGYARPAEGAYSWQHLTFVIALVAAMIFLAVALGIRNRNKDFSQKNKALVWAAILIDGFEIFKIVVLSIRADVWYDAILHNLPLFLCSIQLITIPLAAFSKGRMQEAALDFVSIFGLLGAILGTVGASQNYNAYPVLSMDNVVSGITHCISGFAALYIMVSGMASMKKKNIVLSYGILLVCCVLAYVANILVDYNYMFLVSGDGTPYDILYNLVGGHKVIYPVGVVALFLVYISAFYDVYYLRQKNRATVKC